MFKWICIFLFLGQLALPPCAMASYEYAVIATHKKASLIKQQLKPLFTQQASISAKGYQLIIKASPQIINEIKHLIKQIDIPLKNLLIQLANEKTLEQQLQQTSGFLDKQYSDKNLTHGAKIISTQRASNRENNSIYQARVLEGNWVTIDTGTQIPYYNMGYYLVPNTQFKRVSSGFEAKAELKPNHQVVIYIRAQNHQLNKSYAKRINTRSTETTLSGNLNEWINISKITADHSQGQQGKGYHSAHLTQKKANIQYRTHSRQQQQYFYIKISAIK